MVMINTGAQRVGRGTLRCYTKIAELKVIVMVPNFVFCTLGDPNYGASGSSYSNF